MNVFPDGAGEQTINRERNLGHGLEKTIKWAARTLTWNNFRRHDEGDPGHDHEESGGEVDLKQHRRPPPHHVNLQQKIGSDSAV